MTKKSNDDKVKKKKEKKKEKKEQIKNPAKKITEGYD